MALVVLAEAQEILLAVVRQMVVAREGIIQVRVLLHQPVVAEVVGEIMMGLNNLARGVL
jgi:hypothetical protein